MLISPEDHRINRALRFTFKASNNEAEYEALLAGLRLANDLKIEAITIYSDTQLVVSQVKAEYQAQEDKMIQYLKAVLAHLAKFSSSEIIHIVRADNSNTDALARLACIEHRQEA